MSEENGALDDSRQVSLADEEQVRKILAESILGLWEVVNNITRLRPSRRERYRVSLFGSARVQADTWAYGEVRRLAAALAEIGCDVVTGGGPGLMQAANEGAAMGGREGESKSVGIRVQLPFEQEVNPFVEHAYEHRTFFTRLHQFVLMSDAFVVLPGGIGTVLEMLMIWQLLQVKHLEGTPLLLVGPMWPELVAWARRHMVESAHPLAGARDMEIPRCLATAEETIAAIREHHARWRETQGR